MNGIKKWDLQEIFPQQKPFVELNEKVQNQIFAQRTFSLKCNNPLNYLCSVESFILKDLISTKNFSEIKTLANQLNESITSFFGFETQLNTLDARSDYLFAVSSQKGEREAFARLLQDSNILESFRNQPEWQNIGKFATEWTNPNSILYNKVRGLWLEFDTADSSSNKLIPCVFISMVPLHINLQDDIKKCAWLFDTALPILAGKPLSENMKQHLFEAIQQMPKESLLFNIGIMLSRSTIGIRLVINRIQPTQIIPYLESLGWIDEQSEGSKLIQELDQKISRFVLHISINEDGVDPKIGIECSFYPDSYNLETRWSGFLDYLIKKGLCLPEKKAMLLSYLGVEKEDTYFEFSLDSYIASVKIPENNYSRALVRFISHVKICYKPNYPLEAKAYPGARLFGLPQSDTSCQYR